MGDGSAMQGDAMQDEGSMSLQAEQHCGWGAEVGIEAAARMDEDGKDAKMTGPAAHDLSPGHAVFDSNANTPTAWPGQVDVHFDRHAFASATASFEAASLPSDGTCRRSGEAVTATILKWEQLLQENPNDPMVRLPASR